MAASGEEAAAAAAAAATSINQEQLLHELEQKFLAVKSELSIAESERQALQNDKKAALEEAARATAASAEHEAAARELRQQLLQVTTEKDALAFKLQTASSLAERRLTELEELQKNAKEQHRLVLEAQRQEMEALERAAAQEAQVAPLTHAITRAQKETASVREHSQWLETQLAEKTRTVQSLRQELGQQTHELEELKVRGTEELTSAKRQLESARLATKKMESALLKSKEALKELQASKLHDEQALQSELSAQRRLAGLYQDSAADAAARVTELQTTCEALRKSLAESEQALARETERTKEQVEHLFREQAQASEKRIEALQDDLQAAERKVEELEKKKRFSLQTASAVADLSSAAGEAHLAAHGLSPKQMYDHIVELEETLQAERNEKDKLQLYMDRIVKEVQEKAPILMGLRLDHERAVASHTQLSERLERCMQELAHSKSKAQEAWQEKHSLEKKCEGLAQSVDDLSRQVQHLLFRSQEQTRPSGALGGHVAPGEVASENLVVFKDVVELQTRNQQLLSAIRELTELTRHKAGDGDKTSDAAHLIITADSDDELDQIGASSAVKKRLGLARKEIEELRAEREQEREMITAIVKQRDMYRVLLAQSDTRFLEGGDAEAAAESSTGGEVARKASTPQLSRRDSFDAGQTRALRELQLEFEDYKKEKQANVKLLQESLDQERTKSSEAKLAAMQAQVEATCNKERFEAAEMRCATAENEMVRLRAKTDQLSSLILQHQQAVANAEAKLETASSQQQRLSMEKTSAIREAEFLRKNEEKLQQEVTTLRLDNTNLLKLMESTRRMESGREERDRHEVETLTKKVSTLETRLQDAYEKFDAKEATSGAQLLASEREKQTAITELAKAKDTLAQLKEKIARLEEKKTALEEKTALLEKEATHMREQLRKGASAAAAERVATLETQLRDAQREIQASLLARKTLTQGMTKYKALAEASDKSLAELSAASEKWKKSEAEKLQALEKSRDSMQEELAKARAELKEHISENSKLREEMDRAEQTQKLAVHEATEKQKVLQQEAEGAKQQLRAAREEMNKMKHDLETVQENYERELQLHASEVAKSSASRKQMEEQRKSMLEREAEMTELKMRLEAAEKETQSKLDVLQQRLDEATEAKDAISEQNKLLHSQLERAAAQVRRAHEEQMLKGASAQPSGETPKDTHDKEVDDLRSVIVYLRRESEIAESKLELAQQEVQRERAQIFSLESTIERLRGEIKALSTTGASTDKQVSGATASEDEKRVAQLEQLNLLRESNATLRDESQKNLAKLKEEETKVRALEAKLTPLQDAEAALKTQVATLKQEIVALNDANKRWKQRVDQLVEKYQQVDPAEHDKVIAEKEALTKELTALKTEQAALKTELETLRSSGGKDLEMEKKKVENWSKQYERIKGFAKNWKNKAESLTKQLNEKTKELEDRAAAVTSMETKLTEVQAQISTVTAEKSALETKLAACEASKQDGAAASGAWEKERHDLKARLDLETKKSTQLKDFNARLMSGLKNLKKENSELKDQAAAAPQSTATQQAKPAEQETKMPVPPHSPPQTSSPARTSAASPIKPAVSPVAPANSPLKPSAAATVGASPATVSKPVPAPPALFTLPKSAAKSEPSTTSTASMTTAVTPAAVSVAPTVAPVSASTPATTAAPRLPPTSATTGTPLFASTTSKPALPATTTAFQKPSKPATVPSTQASAATLAAQPKTSAAAAPAEGDSAGMTAEEKLRLFALQSMKKQVAGSSRFMPTKAAAPVPNAGAAPAAAKPAAETEAQAKPPSLFTKLSSGSTGFGAFGSGGASGLVFGKPGITLPVPSSPSPSTALSSLAASSAPTSTTTAAAATTTVALPESQRRNQRLARFGDAPSPSEPTAAPSTTTISTGSMLTKRPLAGTSEAAQTPQKMAKTSEEQTSTTETTSTVTTVTSTTTSTVDKTAASTGEEGKQEEDTPPAQAAEIVEEAKPSTQTE